MILFVAFEPSEFIARIFVSAAMINFFLALFNLLPIPPLDGSKVFTWNIPIWVVTIAIAAIGVFFMEIYVLLLSLVF